MKMTRKDLIKLHWKKLKNHGLNCEIWIKQWKGGKLLLLWNRVNHKVYKLT